MSCQYLGKCSDEDILCDRCIENEDRSHFVAYHEYPPDKWPIIPSPVENEYPYPSPTAIEWPYLPTGDDQHSNDAYWKEPWEILH